MKILFRKSKNDAAAQNADIAYYSEENIAFIDNLENKKDYYPLIDVLRLILMFFACIQLFGAPTIFGDLIQVCCGFTSIAFFIISGYLVLSRGENRSANIVRSIKRSAVAFLAMVIVYFVVNLFFYRFIGVDIFELLHSKVLWFNFLVLNVWPFSIGGFMWYVQALLYAYIIIYFLDRWNLLRFDWIIIIVCLAIALLRGEFSGIVKFEVLGHNYLPGNFFTRALPYILIGGRMRGRRRSVPSKKDNWRYLYIGIAGAVLMIAEIGLLGQFNLTGYYGHLIGMPIFAVALCSFAFSYREFDFNIPVFQGATNLEIKLIYYLCQPVGIGIAVLISTLNESMFPSLSSCIGILTYFVCLILVLPISLIKKPVKAED